MSRRWLLSSCLGVCVALAFYWHFCWHTLAGRGTSYAQRCCQCLHYCAKPVVGQFPAPPESACCIFVCTPLHVLLALLCFMLWVFGSLQNWVWRVLGLELGVAGGARGWVASRAGLWGVLATWVWGRQLNPPGSWAPNHHVQFGQ